MSNDDWMYEFDQDYDGQGKSKQQETDDTMKVMAGCLIFAMVAGIALAAAVVLPVVLL